MVLDPVMDEEDLTAAFHLPDDCLADQFVIIGSNVSHNRQPLFRRRTDRGDVADAGQRHIECARE